MSLILLNLQSNQQIQLNNGTPLIIGRENVKGCFDKRVSRNHGRVTCTDDGKVRLAALHCNPCFFTRNGVPPVLQLNKNEEETLNEGDFLGLLPNAFWFKVTSSKNIEVKNVPKNSATTTNVTNNENDQTIALDNCNKSSSNVEPMTASEDSDCVVSYESIKDDNKSVASSSHQKSNSTKIAWGYGNPEFESTKRLPLHMYEIDDPVRSDRSPKKHSLVDVDESKVKKQKLSSEGDIKPKSVCEIKVEKEDRTLDIPSTSKVECNNQDCKSEPQEEATNDRVEKEGYESGVDFGENSRTERPICQYEGNCYRKNPQHKLDFSHPGDPDFVPYEERPLCPYGAACYRKNEKHKVEFRHPPPDSDSQDHLSLSSSPSSRGEERPPCLSGSYCRNQNSKHRKELYHPPKGYICKFSRAADGKNVSSPYCDSDASSPLPTKRRCKGANSYYEDDDEGDLEDPFLNDASSDEYIPSDLGSEEEEDLDASVEDD